MSWVLHVPGTVVCVWALSLSLSLYISVCVCVIVMGGAVGREKHRTLPLDPVRSLFHTIAGES